MVTAVAQSSLEKSIRYYFIAPFCACVCLRKVNFRMRPQTQSSCSAELLGISELLWMALRGYSMQYSSVWGDLAALRTISHFSMSWECRWSDSARFLDLRANSKWNGFAWVNKRGHSKATSGSYFAASAGCARRREAAASWFHLWWSRCLPWRRPLSQWSSWATDTSNSETAEGILYAHLDCTGYSSGTLWSGSHSEIEGCSTVNHFQVEIPIWSIAEVFS